jgi:ABC-2 type transport system ATP-binding protein
MMPLAASTRHSLLQLANLAPALIPVLILLLGLDIYCLVNLARAKSVRNAPKLAWVIVILCVSAPIGAILYLFFGMDRTGAGQRNAAPGSSQAAPPAERPTTAGPSTIRTAPPGEMPAEAGPIVTTTGLTRDYGGTGLFDVDLVVPRGCVYGLVGLNGAGKTTLLSILAGTRHADRGSVSLAIDRRRMAVCPDVPEFDGWLTGAEVVDLAASLVAPEAGLAAVEAALRAAGLADAAGRRVGGFSRGMLQRLGLACALAGDPELLILDEPTSALDPAGRAEMLALVAAMRGTRTVIFSSHILADVQRVAHQVGILRDGRLLYQGGTRELMDNYLTPSWLLRIADRTSQVATALAEQPWVTRVEPAEPGVLRVDATSIEDGERGIPAVVAACGARQVSCEPAAADLEAAFLALTGTRVEEAA